MCVGSRAGGGVNLSFSKSLWKRDDVCVDDFSSSCRAKRAPKNPKRLGFLYVRV